MPLTTIINASDDNNAATIYLYGGIGMPDDNEDLIDPIAFVSALHALKEEREIDIHLSSVGGDPLAAMMMYTEIVDSPARVRIIVDSIAYSAGSLLLQSADTRIANELSMIMVHPPKSAVDKWYESESDLNRRAEILREHTETMVKAYSRHGIDEKIIREWLTGDEDHYFNAENALSANLIDEIIPLDMAAMSRESFLCTAPRPYRASALLAMRAQHMPDNHQSSQPTSPDNPVKNVLSDYASAKKQGSESGRKEENERIMSIMKLKEFPAFRAPEVAAVLDQCLTDVSCDAKLARERAHEALESLPYSAPVHTAPVNVEAVAPESLNTLLSGPPASLAPIHSPTQRIHAIPARRMQGIQMALEIKAGLIKDRKIINQERAGNEFLGSSLCDLMAYEMRSLGIKAGGTRNDIVMQYTRYLPVISSGGPSQGTDHLPAVLSNIANKAALQGWDAAEETWPTWTVEGRLSNYQPHQRGNLALLDLLDRMEDGKEWSFGTLKDVKQDIQGYFHGKQYGLTIYALVNDDLNQLTESMAGWGEAASATVGNAVFLLLTMVNGAGFGQTMDETQKALFHADHNNLAGTGADPSIDTLTAARESMMTHEDQNKRLVIARPRFLIHGPALFSKVSTLLSSTELTSVSVSGGDTNVESGRNAAQEMNLVPVEETRLNKALSNRWFLSANRRTIEVSGVDGNLEPRVDQMPTSVAPGITYSLSLPFGAAALDYRSMYMNPGA